MKTLLNKLRFSQALRWIKHQEEIKRKRKEIRYWLSNATEIKTYRCHITVTYDRKGIGRIKS